LSVCLFLVSDWLPEKGWFVAAVQIMPEFSGRSDVDRWYY